MFCDCPFLVSTYFVFFKIEKNENTCITCQSLSARSARADTCYRPFAATPPHLNNAHTRSHKHARFIHMHAHIHIRPSKRCPRTDVCRSPTCPHLHTASSTGASERVHVVVRVRPPISSEERTGPALLAKDDTRLTLYRMDAPIPQSEFVFDKVSFVCMRVCVCRACAAS